MTTSVATLDQTLAAIEAGPDGPSTAAIFGVDRAVIAGTVAGASGKDVAAIVRGWRGQEEAAVQKHAWKGFARKIAGKVYPEVRDLVAAHRRQGHTVLLTSAGTVPQVRPLADALGVDHVIATEVEVDGGHLTGNLARPVCAGDALASAVKEFAAGHAIDLAQSHTYAGADDALPLLSLVGVPHPTNPAKQVAALAEQQGLGVLHFDSKGRPGLETIVRSVAMYGTMIPSMLGGVGMAVLNRDAHAVTEFGVHNWVERMFALTGVTLDVQSEENLWSQRPAVFIFNHRNNFDPYIAIRLVRRDWGSVAKREIAGPLLPVMQRLMPNVAFIDRRDAEKAVEGLRPVTDLLRSGVSVLVAPEGTRSFTGQLGRFKKGPFRMAMEAGVPIVPIVIRNADQVAGREAGIIRKGKVDVVVLPAVSVADWTGDDLDERIAGVRRRYADTLANWPKRRG